MLDLIHKARRMFFFDAEGGGKSGGGGSGGGSSTTETVDVEKLFEGIPFDELDDKTQKQLEGLRSTLKTSIATLQSKSIDDPKNAEAIEGIKKQARDFQSQKDILQSQLDKITGGKKPEEDDYLEAARNTLKRAGIPDADVEKQAPLYAQLLKDSLVVFKKDLGKDLGPVIGTVVMQQSTSAFEMAQQMDEDGLMAVPEVAELVWGQVKGRAESGQPSTPELVLNLAKIAFVDHNTELRKKGEPAVELQRSKSPDPASMNTGFSYPGAGRGGAGRPIVTAAPDANAPKTRMNPETEAAVAATFQHMGRESGIFPPGFEPKAKVKRS